MGEGYFQRKNIVLAGFMGTGKTEVGRELARLLDMKLIDVDTEIEKSQKMAINEIFKQFGEPWFREIETEMIKKVAENENIIISAGGGAVLKQENMDTLKKNGIIVCLTATPETILKRTSNNRGRPLLLVENPLERIKELLNFRKPFYEKADVMIDTEGKTPLQIAEEIMEKVKEKR
jgi:shikimate kinase